MLYEQYFRQMFRICLRYARTTEDAEDYLQEAFVRVFHDLRQFRMEGPLGAWIRRVVINTVLQQLRRRKIVFSGDDVGDFTNINAPDKDLPGNLDAELLTRYIQNLPDGYRVVFNMYAIEGYTHQEIADTLGIQVGTSKSQLSKARAMLRSRISALYSNARL